MEYSSLDRCLLACGLNLLCGASEGEKSRGQWRSARTPPNEQYVQEYRSTRERQGVIVRKIAHYFVALRDILSSSLRGRLGRNLDQVSKNSDGCLPYAHQIGQCHDGYSALRLLCVLRSFSAN